jgi:hypothetical protein
MSNRGVHGNWSAAATLLGERPKMFRPLTIAMYREVGNAAQTAASAGLPNMH